MFTRIRRGITDVARMRELFEAAEAEAAAAGVAVPDVEHVVLAAVGLSEGSGREVLAALDTDLDALRRTVHTQEAEAIGASHDVVRPGPAPGSRAVRITGAAEDLFEEAVRSVKGTQHPLSGALFLAIVAERRRDPVHRALAEHGVDADELRRTAWAIVRGATIR